MTSKIYLYFILHQIVTTAKQAASRPYPKITELGFVALVRGSDFYATETSLTVWLKSKSPFKFGIHFLKLSDLDRTVVNIPIA